MSWDARVYLAKKRISKALVAKTYAEMQKRYGAPIVDPDEYSDPDDDDSGEFRFAEFQLRLERDAKAGMYFAISSDDVGRGRHDAEDAGLCMDEWAALLGGAISEAEWDERTASTQKKKLAERKLPKYGAADTRLYLAFDADGNERGRKAVAKELHGVVKVQLLEQAWLHEHRITRIEELSFDGEGVVWGHTSYDVDAAGKKRRVDDD